MRCAIDSTPITFQLTRRLLSIVLVECGETTNVMLRGKEGLIGSSHFAIKI